MHSDWKCFPCVPKNPNQSIYTYQIYFGVTSCVLIVGIPIGLPTLCFGLYNRRRYYLQKMTQTIKDIVKSVLLFQRTKLDLSSSPGYELLIEESRSLPYIFFVDLVLQAYDDKFFPAIDDVNQKLPFDDQELYVFLYLASKDTKVIAKLVLKKVNQHYRTKKKSLQELIQFIEWTKFNSDRQLLEAMDIVNALKRKIEK